MNEWMKEWRNEGRKEGRKEWMNESRMKEWRKEGMNEWRNEGRKEGMKEGMNAWMKYILVCIQHHGTHLLTLQGRVHTFSISSDQAKSSNTRWSHTLHCSLHSLQLFFHKRLPCHKKATQRLPYSSLVIGKAVCIQWTCGLDWNGLKKLIRYDSVRCMKTINPG